MKTLHCLCQLALSSAHRSEVVKDLVNEWMRATHSPRTVIQVTLPGQQTQAIQGSPEAGTNTEDAVDYEIDVDAYREMQRDTRQWQAITAGMSDDEIHRLHIFLADRYYSGRYQECYQNYRDYYCGDDNVDAKIENKSLHVSLLQRQSHMNKSAQIPSVASLGHSTMALLWEDLQKTS